MSEPQPFRLMCMQRKISEQSEESTIFAPCFTFLPLARRLLIRSGLDMKKISLVEGHAQDFIRMALMGPKSIVINPGEKFAYDFGEDDLEAMLDPNFKSKLGAPLPTPYTEYKSAQQAKFDKFAAKFEVIHDRGVVFENVGELLAVARHVMSDELIIPETVVAVEGWPPPLLTIEKAQALIWSTLVSLAASLSVMLFERNEFDRGLLFSDSFIKMDGPEGWHNPPFDHSAIIKASDILKDELVVSFSLFGGEKKILIRKIAVVERSLGKEASNTADLKGFPPK